MTPLSWIKVIEAAYRIDSVDSVWLDGIVETVRPALDHGLGIYAYLYHAPDFTGFQPRPIQFYGCAESTKAMAVVMMQQTTPEIVRDILLAHPAGTTSNVLGPRRWMLTRDPVVCGEIFDSFAVNAIDPTGHGCVIVAPMKQMYRLSPRARSLWTKVSAHIASGHRLRRSLLNHQTSLIESAEAVVDAHGRVQEARGQAITKDARAALRRAASNIDRARTHRKQEDSDAMGLWTALVDGSWSMIDHYDTDGQRFFIACRNDPKVRAHRKLSERELQVATYASFGRSNKHIAYELGISTSTVASHLEAAIIKLGLASRLMLIDLMRALARERSASDSRHDSEEQQLGCHALTATMPSSSLSTK